MPSGARHERVDAISDEMAAPSTRMVLISIYERDDLADLILASPAVRFLPKAPSIASLLRSRA
jgi:hypothetical protein